MPQHNDSYHEKTTDMKIKYTRLWCNIVFQIVVKQLGIIRNVSSGEWGI